jgi:hypothetical protein
MNYDKATGNNSSSPTAHDIDATLRLIASVQAPEGLEDRVHAKLHTAPREPRILEWPARARMENTWMRSAAAAAIAFIVVGGGWGVYSRVQPAKVIAMPPRISAPGSFSSGGAMRTPQTITGPVLTHPATNAPAAQTATPEKHGTGHDVGHVVQMPAAKTAPAAKTTVPAVK